MRKIRKIIPILTAIFLMLSNIFLITNNNVKADAKTNKVILHKILMTKTMFENFGRQSEDGHKGLSGEKYKGNQLADISAYFGEGSREIDNVYFAVKNSDASRYIATDGSEKEENFVLTEENKSQVLGGLTKYGEGLVIDTSKLNQDKETEYTIVEVPALSTYVGSNQEVLASQKAIPVKVKLPFTNEQGVQDTVHIYPKNTEDKPKIDKNFADNADYANYAKEKESISKTIGKIVDYQVKTQIPKDAKYKTVRWEDTMTKGLTYNKDVQLFSNQLKLESSYYNVTQDDSGFVLEFTDKGLEALEKEAKNGFVELELKYSAKVNSAAIVDSPDTNMIKFDYSNRPKKFVDPKTATTKPKDKKIVVRKTWENQGRPSKVIYYLYEKVTNGKDRVVDSKEINFADAVNDFSYNHVFENLDNDKEYYVKEIVDGFVPTYTKVDGGIDIKNSPDNANPKPLIPTSPKVVTYGKKFVKTDEKGERLSGAKFYIKQNGNYLALKTDKEKSEQVIAYEKAEAEYVTYVKNTTKDKLDTSKLASLKETRDIAFYKARDAYNWVADEKDALVLTSNEEGQFEITGLRAGTYQLEEKEAPAGFAKLEKEINFEVKANSYTAGGNISYLAKEIVKANAQRVQNKKLSIPQTGGMGTLIFTLTGLTIMLSAAYAMKKNKQK